MQPIIYFVVPCYNEEDVLGTTVDTLLDKLVNLEKKNAINPSSRILFVDDGSSDRTWAMIEKANQQHGCIGGVKLAHNEGHQNALLAGLMSALDSGCDAAISLDADLQDDVSVIDEFIKNYVSGDEIVYGVRSSREKDTWFKRTSAGAFYKIFELMGAETIPNHADYRLMGRKALEALSEYSEVNLFLRGIVPTLGFKTSRVYYERGERQAGESKYPLRKMISFAFQGITSFSTKPLKFVTALGSLSILVGIGMFIYTLVSLSEGDAVAGWGSLMCSMWFLGGLILMALGIIGEYVGKIYTEVKRRPRYIVEQSL